MTRRGSNRRLLLSPSGTAPSPGGLRTTPLRLGRTAVSGCTDATHPSSSVCTPPHRSHRPCFRSGRARRRRTRSERRSAGDRLTPAPSDRSSSPKRATGLPLRDRPRIRGLNTAAIGDRLKSSLSPTPGCDDRVLTTNAVETGMAGPAASMRFGLRRSRLHIERRSKKRSFGVLIPPR